MQRRSVLRPALALIALLGGPVPISAQPPSDDQAFNRVVAESLCDRAAALPTDPFFETGYPFSVERLNRAMAATESDVNEVGIAVFDNDFIGYHLDPDAPDGESPLRPSRNFPKAFFLKKNPPFSPYFFDSTSAAINPSSYPAIDAEIGHGTSIAGIILGGKYDDDSEPAEVEDFRLSQPNVRGLLTYGGQPGAPQKSWLRFAFIPVDYARSGRSSDPIEVIENLFEKTENSPGVDIVNMSFGQTITDGSEIAFSEAVRGLLIVAAAGNSKRQIPAAGLEAKPISADDKGIMLVVASHNADGKLSHFSNYGDVVTIAAPGCAIKSWLDGDSEARPLSGTSMATAVTSFAAALVRSRWDLRSHVGISLRNRLISSARYNRDLAECGLRQDGKDCVQFGSMLDIEAAVLVNRDFIEFRSCPADANEGPCKTRTAVGTLVSTPDFLGICMTSVYAPLPKYGGGNGLTFNGSVKHLEGNRYQIFYEPGPKVGMKKVQAKICESDGPPSERVVFRVEGVQLDGGAAPSEPLDLPMSSVERIVVRALDRA